MLITVEGFDGSGKTSAVSKLVDTLKATGVVKVISFSEPGGTKNGVLFRAIVKGNDTISKFQQLLLFLASREELYRTEIKPLLDAGWTVITDRGLLSSYCYQVHDLACAQMRIDEYVRLCNRATLSILPDMVIYMDTPFEQCLINSKARDGDAPDVIEAQPVETKRIIYDRTQKYVSELYTTSDIIRLRWDNPSSHQTAFNRVATLVQMTDVPR